MDTYEKIIGYENVLVIKTALDIERENILGHMFILLSNEMLDSLKKTINALYQ